MSPTFYSTVKGDVRVIHDDSNRVLQVVIEGQELGQLVWNLLQNTAIRVLPFEPDKSDLILDPNLEKVSRTIFDMISRIRIEDKNEELAAYLASYHFEKFTPYWLCLLKQGQYSLAVNLWTLICSLVRNWEDQNILKKIHKGTPCYFLAESCLLSGDRELAFIHLYDALLEDVRLGQLCPSFGYPRNAPAYKTASLIDDPANHMYPLVQEMRKELTCLVDLYNKHLGRNFVIATFDNKFLQNPNLEPVKCFFVYNLLSIVEIAKKSGPRPTENDFWKLKNLDTIFNLCLIIDNVLGITFGGKFMGDRVIAACSKGLHLTQSDVEGLARQLNISDADPDQIVCQLLGPQLTYGQVLMPKEVSLLFLAWNLRNKSAHEIKMHPILADRYNEIIDSLMQALFLAVELLK